MPQNFSVRCVWLALLSLAVMLGWQEFIIHFRYGGMQSGLFYTSARRLIPPPLRSETYVSPDSTGYDGQFYRYVAHDPFFRRGFDSYIDDPRHRYGMILVPLMAWTLSGGQDRWIDRAYQLILVAWCALGVYWTCGWLALHGCPPEWGVPVFLLLPATLASLDRLLIDGPLCALFAGQMYYTRLGRWRALYVIALAAPLLRETGIFLLAGILAAAAVEKRWNRLVVFATAAVPALVWTLYVAARTSRSGAVYIFVRPLTGLFIRLFTVVPYPGLDPSRRVVMQALDFLAIAGYILCFALAAKWIWTFGTNGHDGVNLTVAFFLLLGLLLGHPGHLLSAYGYARPLSPLILWVGLMALQWRRWGAVVPPLLVSAGVAIYPAYSTLRAIETLVKR